MSIILFPASENVNTKKAVSTATYTIRKFGVPLRFKGTTKDVIDVMRWGEAIVRAAANQGGAKSGRY